MSKVIIIIQARMGSERLPGKMLLPLGDKTLFEVVIQRIKQCQNNNIVLATGEI